MSQGISGREDRWQAGMREDRPEVQARARPAVPPLRLSLPQQPPHESDEAAASALRRSGYSGSYQGQTQNENLIFLTVRSDRTFTGWLVDDDLPNNCGEQLPGGDLFVEATISIVDDGTFDAQRSGGERRASQRSSTSRARFNRQGRIAGRFGSATPSAGTPLADHLEHRVDER